MGTNFHAALIILTYKVENRTGLKPKALLGSVCFIWLEQYQCREISTLWLGYTLSGNRNAATAASGCLSCLSGDSIDSFSLRSISNRCLRSRRLSN